MDVLVGPLSSSNGANGSAWLSPQKVHSRPTARSSPKDRSPRFGMAIWQTGSLIFIEYVLQNTMWKIPPIFEEGCRARLRYRLSHGDIGRSARPFSFIVNSNML